MRQAVRASRRAGADWIKLATTGGLVSEHDEPLVPELTSEEIEVAVFEAERKGRHVAAHAYGGARLANAPRARGRSVPHARLLPQGQAQPMAGAGRHPPPPPPAVRARPPGAG